MIHPHNQQEQKPAQTEKSQSRNEKQIRKHIKKIKKNESVDFTSIQRGEAQARQIEIRKRSHSNWRSQGMHEPEEEQKLEEDENENDNPVLKYLHERIRNNMDEIGFDESERWNSRQGMRKLHDNVLNNISTQELKAGLDVRALKLIKSWNDGIPEMEKLEKHFTDLLPHCIRPNGYNSDEAERAQQVVTLKTMLYQLTISIRCKVAELSHKDLTKVGFGILASGSLQRRVDELLADPGMQELDIQNIKKVTGEIEKIMKGVCNWTGPVDND